MPNYEVQSVTSKLPYQEVVGIIRDVLTTNSKEVTFEKNSLHDDAFAEVDQVRWSVMAKGKDGFMGRNLWGLNIEITDQGGQRKITLAVAKKSAREQMLIGLSSRGMLEANSRGREVNFNAGVGRQKAQLVIDGLQRSER